VIQSDGHNIEVINGIGLIPTHSLTRNG